MPNRQHVPPWTMELHCRLTNRPWFKFTFGLGSAHPAVFRVCEPLKLQMHYGRTITIFGLTLTPAPYMTLAPPAWLGLEFLDATEGGVQAPSLYLSQEDNGAYLYRPRGHQELTFGSNSSSLAFYIILSQHPEHQPTTAGFDVKVLCELLSSPPPTEPRDRLDGPEYFGGTRKDQRVINWIHNVPSAQGSQARSPGPSQ